ncbi:solute carrier family protein [Arthroderma uncinatum]|uniref:solute carrier family protein n=1 Tax=Arthroderma uncinatum TaxID=74035 RepID=UPI00144A7F78|nr:solute carrier family protein [Arthroderma uncinatum]KAF3490520.1 solute carrier family protein [Arthroderma uncinatum]
MESSQSPEAPGANPPSPTLNPAHQHHDAHHVHPTPNTEKPPVGGAISERGISNTSDPLHGSHEKHVVENDGDVEGGRSLEEGNRRSIWSRYKKEIRIAIHLTIFLLFTGWWIAGLILRRKDLGWVVPFLVYLGVTLRIVFSYVPISVVTRPLYWAWTHTASPVTRRIPEKLQTPISAAVVACVIIIGAFVSEESQDNTRANRAISLFGLVLLLFCLWLTSKDRKKIVWRPVIVGMLMQFVIALFVLRTQVGFDIFHFISQRATDLLGFASLGTQFLTTPDAKKIHWFLVGVVPAIIFFVSLVQLLYYVGFVQWFIVKFATFFFWAMRVSGAEAVVAAASPFIGQGESVMLIRPFINYLTMAEIHQVMCSGFATIAGSVLIAYVGLGVNPQALISSCVMSIPASLAVSKMRYPETEETLTAGRVVIPEDDEHKATNALHAFANGAWLGLKIGSMISATLLCIISLIGLVNGLLTWWGHYLNINHPPLTLELILGYLCYPIAFLLGVPRTGDLYKVAQLIGIKIVANEFVAYTALQGDAYYADLSPRSRLIATYALCGFANIGSLGNQIGVLAQLAPRRIGDVSQVALSAMLTGALSTFTSASIAGLLVTDQQQFFKPVNMTST